MNTFVIGFAIHRHAAIPRDFPNVQSLEKDRYKKEGQHCGSSGDHPSQVL
jgi:hypothetical protein